MWEHGEGLNWKFGQMGFKFQGEETRKREKFDFGEMGFQRKARECGGISKFLRTNLSFGYIKGWSVDVFSLLHMSFFSLDLETPHGCWLGVSKTAYIFSNFFFLREFQLITSAPYDILYF